MLGFEIGARSWVMALAVGLLAGAPAGLRADGPTPADLAGVDAVRITVSQTTPDALTCGIDLRTLLPTVSETLADGGVPVDSAAEVTVTLSVLTGYDDVTGACASAPMLGAYRRVSFFDERAGWLRTGQVVLWQRGTATTTATAGHAEAARHAVSELALSFLSSWRTANSGGLARN